MTSSYQSYEELMRSAQHAAMSMFTNASDEELKAIIDNAERLDAIIADLPQTKGIATEHEMLLAQNKSLAEYNLKQEPKLTAARQRLRSLYENVEKEQAEVNALKKRLDEENTTRSLDTTLALLQAAAQEAEDASEKIAEQFVRGDIDVDTFIKQFIPERQLAHRRKVQAEKLSEVLRQQHAAYSSAQHRPPYQAIPAPKPVSGANPSYPNWPQPGQNVAYPQLPYPR